MEDNSTGAVLGAAYTLIVLGLTSGRKDLLNHGLDKLEQQIELFDPEYKNEEPDTIRMVQPGFRF